MRASMDQPWHEFPEGEQVAEGASVRSLVA
jgi:hypothetical protein